MAFLRSTLLVVAVLALGFPAAQAKSPDPVRVSAADVDSAEPGIAVGPNGAVYVVWVAHRGGEADVMLAAFDTSGRPKGKAARVNARAGEATAWFGDPPTVAVAPDGTIYVGWTKRLSSYMATDLCLSASRDGGRTFAAPVRVNDDGVEVGHGLHSLAVASGGRVCVAWLDERNVARPRPDPGPDNHSHDEPNSEVFVAVSTDGGRSFGPNRRVASDACPCCKTSLAVAPDGRLYVSWRQVLPGNLRHIAVASSSDGGATFSRPSVVSDDKWRLDGCPVSGAALSVGQGGVLRVVWFTAGEAGRAGLYTSESRDSGATFGPRTLVRETQAHGTPVLIGATGAPTVVWQGSEGGASRVMTALVGREAKAGPALTGEFPVAALAGDRLVYAFVTKTGKGRAVSVSISR